MQAASGYWIKALLNYLDHPFVNQLLGAIDHGVHLSYSGPLHSHSRFRHIKNLPMDDRGNAHIQSRVMLRVQEGRLLEVDPQQLGLLPSVNDGIATHFTTIRYASLTAVLEFVRDNQGCHLWKSNLTDAFWHVVTTLDDACLLGFTFDGRFYMETGLTFGGQSSPWLFNLFAEALHWVLQSMTHHPVDHYLDDFFGAVLAAGNPGQPLHALALACSALGLQLAPQKTFWNHTKSEILGIEHKSSDGGGPPSTLGPVTPYGSPRCSWLTTYIWRGLAESSRKRSAGVPDCYRAFVHLRFGPSTPLFPALDLFLTEWACDMARTRLFHSIKHELDALQSWHVDLGFNLHGFSHGWLEQAVRDIKRTHGLRPAASKLPITLPLLRAILEQLRTMPLGAWDRQVIAAAFAVSFACFLQCSEVTWNQPSPAQLLLVGWSAHMPCSASSVLPSVGPTLLSSGCMMGTDPSLDRPSSSTFARYSLASGSTRLSMQGTPFVEERPLGWCRRAPTRTPSSFSVGGTQTAIADTLTVWQLSDARWLLLPST
ncbi:uncharacterized protein UHOD_11917 [Ustilago sp. UG-2017b]|nr:uncharacterized protein UHOD_11917 [Ustilago sp. UG-2017b]